MKLRYKSKCRWLVISIAVFLTFKKIIGHESVKDSKAYEDEAKDFNRHVVRDSEFHQKFQNTWSNGFPLPSNSSNYKEITYHFNIHDYLHSKNFSVSCAGNGILDKSCWIQRPVCHSSKKGLFIPIKDDESLDLPDINLDNSNEVFFYKLPQYRLRDLPKMANMVQDKRLFISKPYSWNHLTHFLLNTILPVFTRAYNLINGVAIIPEMEFSVAWILPPIERSEQFSVGEMTFPIDILSPANFIFRALENPMEMLGYLSFSDTVLEAPTNYNDQVTCYPEALLGMGGICNVCMNPPTEDSLLAFRLWMTSLASHMTLIKNSHQHENSEGFVENSDKIVIINRANTKRRLIGSFQTSILDKLKLDRPLSHIQLKLENTDLFEQIMIFAQGNRLQITSRWSKVDQGKIFFGNVSCDDGLECQNNRYKKSRKTIFVAVHGNALGNLIWIDPMENNHLIEIFPYGFWSPTFLKRWNGLRQKEYSENASMVEQVSLFTTLNVKYLCPWNGATLMSGEWIVPEKEINDFVPVSGSFTLTNGTILRVVGCLQKVHHQNLYQPLRDSFFTDEDIYNRKLLTPHNMILKEDSLDTFTVSAVKYSDQEPVDYNLWQNFQLSSSPSPLTIGSPQYNSIICQDNDCHSSEPFKSLQTLQALSSIESENLHNHYLKTFDILLKGRIVDELSRILEGILCK